MNQPDEPCRRRTFIIVIVPRASVSAGSSDHLTLPRDADVTQPLEVLHDLIQPRIRIRRLVQPGNHGLDEFTRQPYDALIFGLNARPGFQNQPRDIDGEAKREDERDKQIDPGAEGEFLPHGVCPGAKGSCPRAKCDRSPAKGSVDR